MNVQNNNFRKDAKSQFKIVHSNYKKKNCMNCFFYNNNKVCGKHYIRTLKDEVCPDFRKIITKIYGGGRVSPK